MKTRARIIAYHLPQFHPTPENDKWWGKGFTEWTNVAMAKPLFPGHYQPHVPADLGFYDLRLPDARHAQAELARAYGIEGFCYYHYWFGDGRRMLERPVNEILESGEPEFPFCLCWANHSWSGTWKGQSNLIIMEQTYPGTDDHDAHFACLHSAFTDPRYITVDGKPLFLIWNPPGIPEIQKVLAYWRHLAERAGLPGLYLVGINHHGNWDPRDLGLDASTMERMPPKNGYVTPRHPLLWAQKHLLRRRLPTIYAYQDMVDYFLRPQPAPFEDYPTVLPNWDNSPRFGNNALIFSGSSPELFRTQLHKAIDRVATNTEDHRIVFLKAWNEWAEGNHVEPDMKYGTRYLEAIRDEVVDPSPSA